MKNLICKNTKILFPCECYNQIGKEGVSKVTHPLLNVNGFEIFLLLHQLQIIHLLVGGDDTDNVGCLC